MALLSMNLRGFCYCISVSVSVNQEIWLAFALILFIIKEVISVMMVFFVNKTSRRRNARDKWIKYGRMNRENLVFYKN